MQVHDPASLDRFATQIIDSFCGAQLQQIASIIDYPLAVYFGERVLVLRDSRSLLLALSAFRAVLLQNGLSAATSEISSNSDFGGERFTMQVENTYFCESKRKFGTSKIKYYLSNSSSGLRIQMVEYLHWPCRRDVERDATIKSLERVAHARKTIH